MFSNANKAVRTLTGVHTCDEWGPKHDRERFFSLCKVSEREPSWCVLQTYGSLPTWDILWFYKLPSVFIEKKTILRSPTPAAPRYRASWPPCFSAIADTCQHRQRTLLSTTQSETQAGESRSWLRANRSASALLTQKHRPAPQGARGTVYYPVASLHLLPCFSARPVPCRG